MKIIYMKKKNSKMNEPHKFVLNLPQILDLKSSDKHVALQKVSIYYTWGNIRKPYKNNKLKRIAPVWNDEFELPGDSYSVLDIQNYIEYINKMHETLTAIPPFHVYINIINNSLVFKVKDGYKVELQTPETVKLFGTTNELIDKIKTEKKYQILK